MHNHARRKFSDFQWVSQWTRSVSLSEFIGKPHCKPEIPKQKSKIGIFSQKWRLTVHDLDSNRYWSILLVVREWPKFIRTRGRADRTQGHVFFRSSLTRGHDLGSQLFLVKFDPGSILFSTKFDPGSRLFLTKFDPGLRLFLTEFDPGSWFF